MGTKIIFDTNTFYNNYGLNSPILRTTLNFCYRTQDHQFVIPTIIKDEIKSNFREQLEKRYSRIKTGIKWYNKFTTRSEEFLSREEFEADITSYGQFLNRLIEANNILELDYPEYNHRTLVERNSKNHKPFSENDAGYKDTLIWLNILDHLVETQDDLIFVTRNKSDFGTNNKLHSDLLKELDARNIERERVKYYSSEDDFFERIIKPELEVLDLLDQIRNDEYLEFDFDAYIRENIYEWFEENEDILDLSFISDSLEQPNIDVIDEILLLDISDGKRVDENKILLEYNLGVRALCDVLIDRYRPPKEQVGEAINIFNYKYNPLFMAGELYLILGAILLIYFDPIENEVLSTQIKSFRAEDYI